MSSLRRSCVHDLNQWTEVSGRYGEGSMITTHEELDWFEVKKSGHFSPTMVNEVSQQHYCYDGRTDRPFFPT